MPRKKSNATAGDIGDSRVTNVRAFYSTKGWASGWWLTDDDDDDDGATSWENKIGYKIQKITPPLSAPAYMKPINSFGPKNFFPQ
jgi:hypothetical protein